MMGEEKGRRDGQNNGMFCDGVLELDRAEAPRHRGTFLFLLINCYFM